MSVRQKSKALYTTPFSKDYWRDAVLELKDTKMLVFAAVMVAVRVAMKSLSITIGPNLYINTAFLANALGAMVFGPVVASLAAVVSDFLGFMLFPQGGAVYFPPYILVEVAGSVIFALLLYRAKLTPTRVILSRFCICLFVNILLQAPITLWYYQVILGKSYVMFQIPHIIKNLAMFPVESWLLTFVLSLLAPVCYRLGLIYDAGPGKGSMKFTGKQIALLAVLFVIGAGCVMGYLGYYYNSTSLSASYTAQQRLEENRQAAQVVTQHENLQDATVVATVESAYHKFLRGNTTYSVSIYVVDEEALKDYEVNDPKGKYESFGSTLEKLEAMSKSDSAAASKDGVMEKVMTAQFTLDEKTGKVVAYSTQAVAPKE